MAKSLITSTLALLFLAGCAGTGATLESAKNMTPDASDAFETSLYENYIKLAEVEATQGDTKDRDGFAGKAASIARAHHVEADLVICRTLNDAQITELTNARTDLILAFSNRARLIAPTWVALAQTYYDCWIEEEEDGRYPERIKECKEGFYMAMQKVQSMYAKDVRKVVVAAHTAPEMTFKDQKPLMDKNFIVYFDHDESVIRPDAVETLQAVADILAARPDVKLGLRGHTDRTGTDDYNDALSERRSAAVSSWFTANGTKTDISSFGERVPAVFTNDNVRESKNRRVEVILFEE